MQAFCRNASKIEYDRFDKNPVKIDKSDTGNGTSLPRIKQADFETSKALSNVIGNNKVDKDRTVSLVDINKPLVQITGKGVMQPSPFTKEQSPPGDPFAGKGKKQYGFMKYANKKLDQAHPSSLNMGAYSSARGGSQLALSSMDKRATPT